MKITVWTVTTCTPGSPDPDAVQVFGTELEARRWFHEKMKEEWVAHASCDFDTGEPFPFPGNADQAHQEMAEEEPTWGRWNLDKHDIQIPTPVILESMRLT